MAGKITKEELAQSLISYIDSKNPSSINGSKLVDNTVTEAKLDSSVKSKLNKDTYTKTETNSAIDSRINALTGAAPEALDTLVELAAALGDDPNFATTITVKLGEKVDKVEGKGLSTNDYTTTEKNKLAGIAANANNYTHPSTHAATMITEDETHRFVTDAEKSTWNAKASTAVASTTANGLMSSADKSKLNGVAANANNYVHPTNHDASMITQSASYRFVTDTEKSTWNAKASTATATQSANGLMAAADKKKLDGINLSAYQPKLAFTKKTVTLEAASNTIPIGISGFNKDTHLLMVFKNSVYLEVTDDYTIDTTSANITLVAGNAAIGTVFNIIALTF